MSAAPQLWEVCLEIRRAEQLAADRAKIAETNGRARLAAPTYQKQGTGRRTHPVVKVGDRFGVWRVVALLPRGVRSDERVEVICPEGHRREVFVFNLRKRPGCRKCGRS